ncbi:hypothetical protein AB0B31_09500 [Catellatospora citrea]|uniref:hypothetical protein n=1 Tax=Catellatospora citrea TaxID=53366 RepID=UPI0034062E0A
MAAEFGAAMVYGNTEVIGINPGSRSFRNCMLTLRDSCSRVAAMPIPVARLGLRIFVVKALCGDLSSHYCPVKHGGGDV